MRAAFSPIMIDGALVLPRRNGDVVASQRLSRSGWPMPESSSSCGESIEPALWTTGEWRALRAEAGALPDWVSLAFQPSLAFSG